MKLSKLLAAEMYRDGGSLEATFLDISGTERSLFLQVSRMLDEEGYHHGDLYSSRYRRRAGPMLEPISKGSDQEREWMDALAAWIETNIPEEKLADFRSEDFRSDRTVKAWTMDDWKLYWLVLLFDHIPRRE